MLGNMLQKTIPNFSAYALRQHTSLDAITKAYQSAGKLGEGGSQPDQPCLIQYQELPEVSRHDCYRVTTGPCGFEPQLESEAVSHPAGIFGWCIASQHVYALGNADDLKSQVSQVLGFPPRCLPLGDKSRGYYEGTAPLPR